MLAKEQRGYGANDELRLLHLRTRNAKAIFNDGQSLRWPSLRTQKESH